jgi:hypothetical protein
MQFMMIAGFTLLVNVKIDMFLQRLNQPLVFLCYTFPDA